MNLYILYAVFGTVALIGLFSIILAVQNWLKLNKMTSNISNLEAEIYKKSQEFDLLRKKASTETSHRPVVIDEPQPQKTYDKSVHEFTGEFCLGKNDTTDSAPAEDSKPEHGNTASWNESSAPQASSNTEEYDSVTPQKTDHTKSVHSPSEPPPLPEGKIRADAGEPPSSTIADITEHEHDDTEQSDVLDIIEDNQKPQDTPLNNPLPPLVIPLYSDASKDANFYNLWNTIHQKLPSLHGRHVNIDFSNILFIYEKEIELLESIYIKLSQNNCSVKFTNCSTELVNLLKKKKQLASLIDQ